MKENYIAIISGKETARICVNDVVMVERNRRKLCIVTEEKCYDYYERIENIEPLLDQRFYPCLKGCYINLDKVISMADQKISFENGYEFYLGRENFLKAKQNYKKYLKNKAAEQ